MRERERVIPAYNVHMCMYIPFLFILSFFSPLVRPVVVSLAVHVPLVAVESMSQLISFRIDDAAPPVSLGDIYWRFSPTFSNDPYSSDTVDITGLVTRLGNSVYTFSNDKRSLTVSQLNQTDEGRYFLIAVNPAGEHYSHIDVIIHGKRERNERESKMA